MDTLIWVKNVMVLGRSDYHHRHEAVLYGWRQDAAHYFCPDRKQDSVFEIDRPPASPFHPTSKPIELVARMIRNSSRTGDLASIRFAAAARRCWPVPSSDASSFRWSLTRVSRCGARTSQSYRSKSKANRIVSVCKQLRPK